MQILLEVITSIVYFVTMVLLCLDIRMMNLSMKQYKTMIGVLKAANATQDEEIQLLKDQNNMLRDYVYHLEEDEGE